MAWGATGSAETSDFAKSAHGGQAVSAQRIETSRCSRVDHHPRWSTEYIEDDPKFCEACGECVEVCRRGGPQGSRISGPQARACAPPGEVPRVREVRGRVPERGHSALRARSRGGVLSYPRGHGERLGSSGGDSGCWDCRVRLTATDMRRRAGFGPGHGLHSTMVLDFYGWPCPSQSAARTDT